MRVLVVNAGSSSLKLSVLDGDDAEATRELAAGEGDVAAAIDDLGEVDAVGHRIVHGGTRYHEAVVIDEAVQAALEELTDLAPLHQPKSLQALEAVRRARPDVPAVACFDTAFHAGLPGAAATYALPREWRERWGIRRFGFHGLSHAYASRRAAELLGRPIEELRTVTCHLGAGASLAAVHGGRSVDTTMGFTPLDGLVMATRSGSVDPGMVLWMLERCDLNEEQMADALEHESGISALAGTADMREVIERTDPEARLALDVYLHRLRAGIASMAAAMDGLDAIVFTGGVGEHAPAVRSGAAGGLGFLGIALDDARNEAAGDDEEITASGAPVRALVVRAREDLEIARQVRALLDR